MSVNQEAEVLRIEARAARREARTRPHNVFQTLFRCVIFLPGRAVVTVRWLAQLPHESDVRSSIPANAANSYFPSSSQHSQNLVKPSEIQIQ